eukprot:TRINITY_DN7319_c0_g1_i3.p1 TRINITY_DN7319_c0_g1~~TRINITY_DN7319_c0_g1_i3.p1  ORF type:complete len:128 (-),score=19.94 TRINITY_DN7319_c0_g1_i3:368-751(-)
MKAIAILLCLLLASQVIGMEEDINAPSDQNAEEEKQREVRALEEITAILKNETPQQKQSREMMIYTCYLLLDQKLMQDRAKLIELQEKYRSSWGIVRTKITSALGLACQEQITFEVIKEVLLSQMDI